MTETQAYLLKLLKEIDEICVANGIEYYIFAGSMLGLERNEGFLPWDDDVDVVMTKKNYEKFSELMRTSAPSNRIFECVERNKEYPLHFGKYISTETSHITRSLAFGNSSAGIWIDVMYVVPLPRDPRKVDKIKKWFCCYCELENEIYMEHKNRYKGFYWRYQLGLFLIRVFGKKRVMKHFKKMFDYWPEEDCDSYLLYHSLGSDFRQFDKRFFEKPVRRKYGGIDVYASPDNRGFCRAGYGDSWMMVPKESHQEVHTVILDFELPYDKYVEDYMIFLDKDEVDNNIKQTKKRQTKLEQKRRPTVYANSYMEGLLVHESLKNRIKNEKIDLKQLLEEEKYVEIGEIYQEYFELQFRRSFLFWRVFVPLEDELLYPILAKMVCYDGKYYDAEKILKLREESGRGALTSDLLRLRELIEVCRQISVFLWDKEDFDSAESLLKETKNMECCGERFCIDLKLCDFYISFRNAKTKEQLLELRENVTHLLAEMPEQGECMKVLGDIEFLLGNKWRAKKLYEHASEQMNNGLLLLEIAKRREEWS